MENTQVLLNIVWTMVGAFLVYFMQAGFAMVETGFTRAKNSGNILMKNMMDFRARLYFLLYHRICADVRRKQCLYRNSRFLSSEIAGRCRWHVQRTADRRIHDFPDRVLCNIGNDCIRSYGRENQIYLLFDLLRSHQHFIYPITGHWIWGGGWLSQIGFHDFAGSTAVHMVGGLCALAGAKMVGPRIGKYTKEGKPVSYSWS